jgi:hypothetical protein
VPWNAESDDVAGAALARSEFVVGVCANATVANNADPANPAVMYFANILVFSLV